MKNTHEWHEQDEEAGERRFFRAEKFGRKWSMRTTLKTQPDWDPLDPIPLPVLEALRDVLHRKYLRRRVSWEDVVDVEKLIVAAGGVRVHSDEPKGNG